jgi:hypothetical protein
MKNKALPKSTLTSKQTKFLKKTIGLNRLEVTIRFDDECKNGHNSFAVTGDYYRGSKLEYCGMLHDLVHKHFPELRKYLKWHLTSTDGPMHYVANTLYWVEQGNFEYARNTAVMPNAPDAFFTQDKELLKKALALRLPGLMIEFKEDMEELGFVY